MSRTNTSAFIDVSAYIGCILSGMRFPYALILIGMIAFVDRNVTGDLRNL